MSKANGIGVSSGVAMGEALCVRHTAPDASHVLISDKEAELRKADAAIADAREKLKNIVPGSEDEKAMLFVAMSFLEDPEYIALIHSNIRELSYSAAWAVEAASERYSSSLEKLGDEYFRERAGDIQNVKASILSSLAGVSDKIELRQPSVIVADYLTPAELISLPRGNVLGIASDKGGLTSHIAILARSANIPAVLGLGDFSSKVSDGMLVAVNADEGTAVSDPDRKTRSHMKSLINRNLRYDMELKKGAEGPAMTADGRRIHLLSNIAGPRGVKPAIEAGAEGIGLYRTEFLALHKDFLLSGAKEEELYIEAAKEMGPYGPVTFRTFDFGGDKQIEWMNLNEENPILGWRAVRFCMERKDIFAHQLAAILKASAYADDVRIMFPMISGIEELKSVLAFFDEVKAICRASGVKFNEDMQIGTMIEVPSAAICSDILADYVDFMSIGTNDLIQYTLAVDRGNDKISYLYKPLHPAVLRLIKYVVDSAKAKGVTVSMCGEMAGMPEYLPILIGMGFDELSMANHSVLVAKKRMRELDSISCTRLVNHVLSLPDAVSVEAALKEFTEQYGKA